jgi:hypothetical protein
VIEKVNNQHNHRTSVLEKFARNEEKRMIQAATDVGTASTSQVLSQIKVNIERSELPGAKAMLRKSRCLSPALFRAKKSRLGYTGVVPKTAEKILTNLPEQFKTTFTLAPPSAGATDGGHLCSPLLTGTGMTMWCRAEALPTTSASHSIASGPAA